MPRKLQPPRLKSISTSLNRPPTWWTIYKLAAKQTWLGFVEATTEAEAVEKAAVEFKQYAPKRPRG